MEIKRVIRRYVLVLLLPALLAACLRNNSSDPIVVEVTRLVPLIETVAPIEVTRIVVATPAPPSPGVDEGETVSFHAADPDLLRHVVSAEPVTLDPVLAADLPGLSLLTNVIEPLLYAHPYEPGAYVPLLATEWVMAEDGLTAVFTIRSEVTFSNGSPLTASDIAYSVQRALLMSPPGGPQGQLLEPLFGYTSNDVTEAISGGIYAGDREALIANSDLQDLTALCEQVKGAIVADDAAGTLTVNLIQSWGALPATLSQIWTGAIDREWATEQGAWDGACETWQNWYAPSAGESSLESRAMGTGPYVLDHWTPEVEYRLQARSDYWRAVDDPMWEGADAPRGLPAVSRVLVQFEPDAAVRLALLQAGEAGIVEIPPALRQLADQAVGEVCSQEPGSCVAGENARALLRKIAPLAGDWRTDLLFNFAVTADGNPFLGSGQLDGNGITANFFDDFNTRRGFSYCVDPSAPAETVFFGLSIPNNSLIPPFVLGHNEVQETFSLDRERCADEFRLAWSGQLGTNGFRLQVPFVTGNRTQEAVLGSLQENLFAVDPRYQLELLGIPESSYMELLGQGRLPLLFLTWNETLHDPHNWVVPYTLGSYTEYQAMPDSLQEQFALLVAAGVAATDPTERNRIYADLGRVRFSVAPNIIFPQAGGAEYQQRWVTAWLTNPANPATYYYAYAQQ